MVLSDYLPKVSLAAGAWGGIEELVKRLDVALASNDEDEFERALIEIEQRAVTRLPAVGGKASESRPTPPPPQLLEFMNKLVHTLDDHVEADVDGERA